MDKQPKAGDTATCRMCGGRIVYVGPYWAHDTTGAQPRHPAEPVAPVAPPRRSPQPHLAAILQAPTQCQVEADGDMLWA